MSSPTQDQLDTTTPTTVLTSRKGLSRVVWICLGLTVVLFIVAGLRLAIGTAGLGWPDIGEPGSGFAWRSRLWLLALGAIVGMNLSVSGVALQGLLRNPLAEPFILGLSTGAAAGMMAQRWLWYQMDMVTGSDQLGALIGAIVVLVVVYMASRRHGLIDPLGLLLTGVVVSTIGGAMVMFFNYSIGQGGLRPGISRWMMGYLNDSGTTQSTFIVVAVVGLVGLGYLIMRARAMDVATLSDAEAQSLGVNMGRLRLELLLIASALAASAVVLAGPIAFVGLVCPHLARLMLGPAHRGLLIASALLGASLIVAADTLTAALDLTLGIGSMPIGVFTAIVGGLAFLWMLRPKLGQVW